MKLNNKMEIITSASKKGKQKEEYFEEEFYNRDKEKKIILNIDYKDIGVANAATYIATAACKRKNQKVKWLDLCYEEWPLGDFKQPLQIEKKTFNLILIETEATNLNSNPIIADRKLSVTIYPLGHGTTFTTLLQLFAVSLSLASGIFNHVYRVMVSIMYSDYLKVS